MTRNRFTRLFLCLLCASAVNLIPGCEAAPTGSPTTAPITSPATAPATSPAVSPVATDVDNLVVKTANAIAAIPPIGPGQNNMLGWFSWALTVGADLTPVLQTAQQTVNDLQGK